ncbi:alanine dehydrogenase [Sphingobacterium alkalisoli]|uniref:alanine dehydrogenase n=1 Tax=Sphingobacterium alkalisoli TaxID=1874115 RepID=A0A4U0GZK1_9SPHI|nr:alanine dehydrogenase [Sphingobacterium alkalisoli]TJY64528.1 alanine dehydrogenase [Sphingobacterium alkalisoli]GGH21169.1 alanine dehydrogenase [Sphingobacterium alkalisoli]
MSNLSKIAQQAFSQTQEAFMPIGNKKNSLVIGIPREIVFQEKRVALTPLSVALLIENGHKVILESKAGEASNFLDHHYSEQGAEIVSDKESVFKADIIIKIASPTLEEVALMKNKQILFSSQQPSLLQQQVLNALMKKQVTALSYEYLQDEGGHLTVVRAMSEIVGATSTLIAAEYLSNVFGGKGLMLGGVTGVPPTEMVIIGAGTVGEFAARTAIALGAQVKVFDSSVYRLRRLQNNVGSRVFTSVMQPIILNKAVVASDVVIGALRAKNGRSSCVISEDTVSKMKPNSVLIDVSIDQGGCFETSEITTHDHPIFRKYDVIHYCVPNIASRVARTATYALTNIFTPILLQIAECGGLGSLIWSHHGVRNAVYLYQGSLTNKDMADKFKLPFKNLDLMIVANQ